MDFINEIDNMLMTSSSSEDEKNRVERRHYRTFPRKTVHDFDDVDFHMYSRVTKNAFWRLHRMTRYALDGDGHR